MPPLARTLHRHRDRRASCSRPSTSELNKWRTIARVFLSLVPERLKILSPNNHLNRGLIVVCSVELIMAPRAHWKGYLKLSLVSAPIALYPAISAAERISFRQVNKATGNRLRQQLVDSVTGEQVPSSDKGRCYEVEENQFVMVKDEELEIAREVARGRPFSAAPSVSAAARRDEPRTTEHDIRARREEAPEEEEPPPLVPPPPRIENNRTIEVDRFLPREQLDPRYYNTPYYIAPRDLVGQEAFAVIRDAMAAKNVVGMGRVVLANRERPIMIEPMGAGLRGITLRYAHEVRSETE
jgi:DNA end-binding protein Ku